MNVIIVSNMFSCRFDVYDRDTIFWNVLINQWKLTFLFNSEKQEVDLLNRSLLHLGSFKGLY